jgi:hypothetical protein
MPAWSVPAHGVHAVRPGASPRDIGRGMNGCHQGKLGRSYAPGTHSAS